jgi:hypothetical protein
MRKNLEGVLLQTKMNFNIGPKNPAKDAEVSVARAASPPSLEIGRDPRALPASRVA